MSSRCRDPGNGQCRARHQWKPIFPDTGPSTVAGWEAQHFREGMPRNGGAGAPSHGGDQLPGPTPRRCQGHQGISLGVGCGGYPLSKLYCSFVIKKDGCGGAPLKVVVFGGGCGEGVFGMVEVREVVSPPKRGLWVPLQGWVSLPWNMERQPDWSGPSSWGAEWVPETQIYPYCVVSVCPQSFLGPPQSVPPPWTCWISELWVERGGWCCPPRVGSPHSTGDPQTGSGVLMPAHSGLPPWCWVTPPALGVPSGS